MNTQDISYYANSYNKVTLSFHSDHEAIYRHQHFTNSLAQIRIAIILTVFLYAIFGLLDYRIYPDFADEFMRIRFLYIIPFAIGVFALSYTNLFQSIWQELMLVCFIIGGIGISVMTMHEPDNFTYYAGIILVLFCGYVFFKLRFLLATIGGWTIVIAFNLLAILTPDVAADVIISNNFFFISANLIGMTAAYSAETQSRKNFYLNQQLDTEKEHVKSLNKNLERKVKKRTNELVRAIHNAEQNSANIKAIIEGTNESIWAFNKAYEVLYVNKSFKKEYHTTFETWLKPGINLLESLPRSLKSEWKKRYDRVLKKLF